MLSRKKGHGEDEDSNLRERQALSGGGWVRGSYTRRERPKEPTDRGTGTFRQIRHPGARGKGQPRLTTIFKQQEVAQPSRTSVFPRRGTVLRACPPPLSRAARPRPLLPGRYQKRPLSAAAVTRLCSGLLHTSSRCAAANTASQPRSRSHSVVASVPPPRPWPPPPPPRGGLTHAEAQAQESGPAPGPHQCRCCHRHRHSP